MLESILAIIILLGAGFTLIGSLGLAKMPDFFMRLHGPTKASTIGVGSLLISSTLYFSLKNEGISLHEMLVALFLFMTAPVSAHMMAKAALHLKVRQIAATQNSTNGEQKS